MSRTASPHTDRSDKGLRTVLTAICCFLFRGIHGKNAQEPEAVSFLYNLLSFKGSVRDRHIQASSRTVDACHLLC